MSDRILRSDGTWSTEERAWLPLQSFLDAGAPSHCGVLLTATDDPAELNPVLDRIAAVAIEFPIFTDGRGYSIAAILRRRGYRGDLRAVGDVLVDQLFFLKRVGFSSFALRASQDVAVARRFLAAYSDSYQAAHDQPLPAFRRIARPGADRPVQPR